MAQRLNVISLQILIIILIEIGILFGKKMEISPIWEFRALQIAKHQGNVSPYTEMPQHLFKISNVKISQPLDPSSYLQHALFL